MFLFKCFGLRKKVQYSAKQISDGLDLLSHKTDKINLSAQIISPYFQGIISGKKFIVNEETIPFVIILQDVTKYLYGQLGRCYFDTQGRENNTASLLVLMNQITNSISSEDAKKFKAELSQIRNKLHYAQEYKKKLRTYCNKHFAHSDIKSIEEEESAIINLSIPWNEFLILIEYAKQILKLMFIICQKPSFDFSDNVYNDYRTQFWNLINLTEVSVTPNISNVFKS